MDQIYVLVIVEIDVPGKAPDIKYINFTQVSVTFAGVDNKSIIDVLTPINGAQNKEVINNFPVINQLPYSRRYCIVFANKAID